MECIACNEGYFLQKHTHCLATCPERQFDNAATWTCDDCSTGCYMCETADVCGECDPYYQLVADVCEECSDKCVHCEGDSCTECDAEWFIDFDGTCTQDCGDGNFADDHKGACTKCDESCTLCYGADSMMCTACVNGFYTPADMDGCLECESKCSECTGPTATECQACEDGFFFDSATTCYETCPDR